MHFIKTPLDVVIIEPMIFEDSRGYFYEVYNEHNFRQFGIDSRFPIESISRSTTGVIRGLHFQKPPHDQTKMIKVLEGKILDVSVDVRKGSSNFGACFIVELSSQNKKELYIPTGFAHGFAVLEDAIVMMKMSTYYNKESEMGVNYADPDLNIDWPFKKNAIVSQRDLELPLLKEIEKWDFPSVNDSKQKKEQNVDLGSIHDTSCFLSHSTLDKAFANKIYGDLLKQNIKCWYSPKEMKIGSRIRQTLDDSIKSHTKLLLILSKNSVNSSWVEKEVETALEIERRENKLVLFPIAIDNEVFSTSIAWAADIRRSIHIGDFTNWSDDSIYQKSFELLSMDLKSSM